MKTVLLAENCPDYLKSLGDYLFLSGYHVIPTPTVAETMEELDRLSGNKNLPDIAVVGLNLGDCTTGNNKDGLVVIQRAQELGIPCICVYTTMLESAVHSGAELVDKTDGPEVLLAAVKKLMRMKQLTPA